MRQATISGIISKSAEWKTGGQGEFLVFSVATSNGKDKSGTYRQSTFVNCTMYDNEYSRTMYKFLTKGGTILVQGEIGSRAWLSKDGKPESSLQLRVDKIELLSKKESGAVEDNNPVLQSDDIPF